MDNEKLFKLIEIQQAEIKSLREQIILLKEVQDNQRDTLEGLTKNVMTLWDFIGDALKIKKPKKK